MAQDNCRVVAINDMINKYSVGLRGRSVSQPDTQLAPSPIVVLLTGSTGNLGSQILVELVLNERFTKVYAFNRPNDQSILERHKAAFDDKGLDTSLLIHPKVVFVCGDTSQASLGLAPELGEEIRSSVTLIIHNAWTIRFNLPLASFEENVRGTRHLIDFALSSPYHSSLRFLFISSISSAWSWKQNYGPLPEEIILDSRVAVGLGYGESKYVAERILASSGLHSCSIRVTQLTGSSHKGSWPATEWFPRLIKTCIDLQCFFLSHGVVSWIPVDIAARSIVDIGLAAHVPDSALNLAHPLPIAFASLVQLIGQELSESESQSPTAQYPLVPGNIWLSRMMTHVKQTSDQKRKKSSIVKLMEFFVQGLQAEIGVLDNSYEAGGLPVTSTNRMQLLSPTLRGAAQIGRLDVQMWLTYWKSIGLLEQRREVSTSPSNVLVKL